MRNLLTVCVLVLGLGVGHAHAASLQINAAGLLTGATGVMVNGIAHDVRFQAGSCNSVFNGCNPTLNLFFTDGASALAASQALLDQVFLGQHGGVVDPTGPGLFDGHPGLTQGCTDAFPFAYQECLALTPYGFRNGIELLVGAAINYGSWYEDDLVPVRSDNAALSSMIGGGTPTSPNQTFAVWSLSPVAPTAVPEPSTFALLGAGLAAFGLRLRRRVTSAA